jgi:hypothetical protein
MPASEVMSRFRKGKLHSGRGGKIVRSKKQARAIQLSYLRKEGHNIPKKSRKKRTSRVRRRSRTSVSRR